MWRYYELLSFRPIAEIAGLKREVGEGRNPRDVKVLLAQELVARFHSQQAAEEALVDFETRFKQGMLPEDVPECVLSSENGASMNILQALKQSGLTASTSEAMRMIDQGAVKADNEKVSDKGLLLPLDQG